MRFGEGAAKATFQTGHEGRAAGGGLWRGDRDAGGGLEGDRGEDESELEAGPATVGLAETRHSFTENQRAEQRLCGRLVTGHAPRPCRTCIQPRKPRRTVTLSSDTPPTTTLLILRPGSWFPICTVS